MSIYVWRSSLPYQDYLQAKSFEDTIRSDISKQTRSIIASNEELQREHISISENISKNVEDLSKTVSGGFEQLSCDVQALTQGVSELNATFQWGFSEMLTAVGRVSDALTDLIRIAKTPAQTWAYEQFEIARDAFRQDLYEDALEYLNRAIAGYAGNTGYKLEYRFHYLLGTIRIGSFKNNSPEIINPEEAERAFLNAAKYAKLDQPKEAGRAYLAAGWAAYCQGKLPESQLYSEQAISLHPELAEAHFQLAKVHMHLGNHEQALPSLRTAIKIDRGYSIKSAADDDFKPYDKKVYELIDSLREESKEIVEKTIVQINSEAAKNEGCGVDEFSLTKYADLSSAKRLLQAATKAANNNTYYGYLDAKVLCEQAKNEFKHAFNRFLQGSNTDVKRKISDLDRQISNIQAEINSQISEVKGSGMQGVWATIMVVGIIAFFVLGCTQCSVVNDANIRQAAIRKEAAERTLAEMRRRGYDPDKMSVQQGRDAGFPVEGLPPRDTGSTGGGTWFAFVFWGTLVSIGVALTGNSLQKTIRVDSLQSQKSTRVFALESERNRMQHIESQLQAIK